VAFPPVASLRIEKLRGLLFKPATPFRFQAGLQEVVHPLAARTVALGLFDQPKQLSLQGKSFGDFAGTGHVNYSNILFSMLVNRFFTVIAFPTHASHYNVRNMRSSTITSKGQITIPVQVRAALGPATGDRVEFVETGKGQFAIVAATRSVRELKGLFRGKRSKPVSTEEMNAAVAKRASLSR